MRIRAVDERNGETDPKKVITAMLGVGFDRDTSPGQRDTCGHVIPADINPFLLLEAMRLPPLRPALRPGFVINWSARTLVLGLGFADGWGYSSVQLKRQKDGWAAPTVAVALPDAGIILQDAILLVDSGVGNTIVQAPKGIEPPLEDSRNLDPVDAGQRVQVTLSGLSKPIYAFRVGDRTTGAPTRMLWGHNLHDGRPFINTGRHAFSQFDYLFDADKGRLGFYFV
jgi:hypothetical protein